MDNNIDEKLIIMQYLVDTNKQYTDDIKKKLKKHDYKFIDIKKILKRMFIPKENISSDRSWRNSFQIWSS